MKRHLVLPRSVAALAALLLAAPARAAVAPLDFVVENAVPGVGFNNPTALAFTPDGRILVAEKRGVVRLVKDGVKLLQPMWSGEAEVLNNGDRGLLSIAVDPHYATNHYVYLAYAVDPDSNGVDDNDDAFGRVTRYRTSEADSNVIDPASRTVLIGATWSEGFPSGSSSHAVGALRWGADGSLLVSWGEGAHGVNRTVSVPVCADIYWLVQKWQTCAARRMGLTGVGETGNGWKIHTPQKS